MPYHRSKSVQTKNFLLFSKLIKDCPIGCHLTTGTAEVWCLGTTSCFSVRVFHTNMEPSVEPTAMYCPSGLKEQRVCSPIFKPSAVKVAMAWLTFRSINLIAEASWK